MQSDALVSASNISTQFRPVVVGGANRGARETLPVLAKISRDTPVVVTFVDPAPQRSVVLARDVASQRLLTRGIEGRIENVLPRLDTPRAPLILHVDDPQVIATTLANADLRARSILTYLFARLPSDQLLGIRSVLRDGDDSVRQAAVLFFERLAQIRARAGSKHVFGQEGRVEHMVVEPLYRRRWFGDHVASCLTHAFADTVPDFNSFEVTADGTTTLPLLFHEARSGWTPASDLAHILISRTSTPIVRGDDFMIAEIGAHAIRLHIARIRVSDGAIVVENKSAQVSAFAYAEAAEAKRREEQLRLALERARRETLSRTQPVWTSD